MLLQFHATLWSGTTSQLALRYLTAAFVAIAVPLLVVTRRQGYARGLWIATLAIFAISGFHMSTRHIGSYPWPLELVGHHASLPLAFAILFFDYRFAFADLFLKRGVALVALTVVVAAAVFGIPIAFGLHDLTTRWPSVQSFRSRSRRRCCTRSCAGESTRSSTAVGPVSRLTCEVSTEMMTGSNSCRGTKS